jgi:uncharacterized membrane protein YfcA
MRFQSLFMRSRQPDSLALLPLAVAANFLGIWLVLKTPTEQFYRIAYLLMLLISLALLWQGWRGLGS